MKSVFITGANRGIGFETARQLGKMGYFVILGCRDPEKAKEVVAALTEEGCKVDAITIDVESDALVEAAAAYVSSKTNGTLDVLINNAGYGVKREASAVNLEDMKRCYDVNVIGTVRVTEHFLEMVKRAPAGRIVNLSSIMGSIENAFPDIRSVPYCTSKAALNMYTAMLAKSLADTHVKVNSAHPGWVRTDMGGADAPLDVTEGAETSVYLATLPDDGPTGGFYFKKDLLPW